MLYISRKKSVGGNGNNQHAKEESGNSCHIADEQKTRDVVAKETGVSPRTIANDAAYAEACDHRSVDTKRFV